MAKDSLLKTHQKTRSAPFQATRKQHLNEAAEDYTELVAKLIQDSGEARIRDLAIALGISHVTALRTVRRLVRDGYLLTENRGPIILTKRGQELAASAARRHEIIYNFLIKLGVPAPTANIDAEGIEHHVSSKTLQIFKRFLES